MSVFTTGHRNQPWLWQVTLLCFVLGTLLAASLQTSRVISRSGFGSSRVGVPSSGPPININALKDREQEIARLNAKKTELENALGKGTGQLKTLNDELQKMKILAGLTPMRGPGIVLTLQDSKKRPPSARMASEVASGLIHDVDLQLAVNELQQAGAEALAINNQRITSRTAIRCVGPTILVNSVPLVPPYTIHAIGDADTLWGGLNLPFGVLDGIRRQDPTMFKLE